MRGKWEQSCGNKWSWTSGLSEGEFKLSSNRGEVIPGKDITGKGEHSRGTIKINQSFPNFLLEVHFYVIFCPVSVPRVPF